LRTQQVIAHESGVGDVVDPLGGSFLVEEWTAQIRDRARELIAKIDALGGAVAAIEKGFLQREIEDSAYAAQREIEEGKRLVVGVNAFREAESAATPILSVDPKIEEEQVARLRAFRASRDAAAAKRALETLQENAREDRNLMPGLIEAVGKGATLGEIVASLKQIYGEHRAGN
jgi:methylmalonyl-CoA mutase N-terminal domain/subunit